MFPGCMSAWKKPSRNTWVKKISTPVRASFGISTPCRRSSCTRLTGVPRILCIVMTVLVQKSQYTSGTASSGESRKLRRSWLACAASRMRSSSSDKCRANSATTSRGFKRLPSAQKRSTRPAAESMSARSFAITGSIPGRRILTAASVPPGSTARCTWATDALATGCSSNFSKIFASGLPNARSTSATASSPGNGGTRSWSFSSSSARSAGKRSRRVESTWPNLTKMGPSASSARRSRAPRGSLSARKKRSVFSVRARPLPEASANWSSPKRRAILRILARRSKEMEDRGAKRPIYQNWPSRPERGTGFSAVLARARQVLYAFFEPGYVVAQRLDAAAKVHHIGGPREQGLLLGPVFGEAFGEAQCGVALPRREGSAAGSEAVGDDVAEHSGEIFLEIPDEVAEKIVHGARQVCRAFYFNPLSGGLVASKQERQGARGELQDEGARRFCLRPIEKAVVGDREAQVWKRRAAKFHGLTRKGFQSLSRPRLLLQKMVQGCEGAALDHGVSGPGPCERISWAVVSRRAASLRNRSPAFACARSPRRARPVRSPLRESNRKIARSPNAARLR